MHEHQPRDPRRLRTKASDERRRGVLISVALHTAIVLPAFLVHAVPRERATPVTYAVDRSLFAEATPPPTAEHAPPPIHAEVSDDQILPTILEPTPDFRALAETHAPPIEATAHAPSPNLKPVRPFAHGAPVTELPPPIAAVIPDSVERAEVPSPIDGENPAPVYPQEARRRRIQGTVLIRCAVDPAGAATRCAIVTSSGSVLLDHAALTAARRWRFQNGPGEVDVPFVFVLRS